MHRIKRTQAHQPPLWVDVLVVADSKVLALVLQVAGEFLEYLLLRGLPITGPDFDIVVQGCPVNVIKYTLEVVVFAVFDRRDHLAISVKGLMEVSFHSYIIFEVFDGV